MGCIVSGFFVPTMFPGFLGFSAPVSVTPALVVIAVPATVVEYIAPAPAVSYAAPESLFGRLRDQSKLTIKLLWRRHRILMESRTQRLRTISHGMKPLARLVQGRNSATASFWELIPQHSPPLPQSSSWRHTQSSSLPPSTNGGGTEEECLNMVP